MSDQGTIHGERVVLRPATVEDQRMIYEWFACSDSTPNMIGPPMYPESPIPSWEEFQSGWEPHYFDDSAPLRGRCFLILAEGEPVGQVNYNDIEEREGRKRTELDIWMRSEQYCGRGSGTDALAALIGHLAKWFAVEDFMVQPSARNPRAIRAYEKIGFVRLDVGIEEARQMWGPSDNYDSVYMVKTIAATRHAASPEWPP
jgi:diamine N-acetyltransferase